MAIMSATLVLSLTFIDYQFKVVLRGSLQNDELAGFMGSFYGFAGLLALAVQVFAAGKLLTRFGVMTAILVFPAALFMGSVAMMFMPVLALAVAVKGSDKVLGDTINSSVNQLVMLPIPAEWRNRAKGFLDGVVRNGAKGIAGISLIALSPLLSIEQFSIVVAILLVGCIVAAVKVKGAYLKTLLSTLKTRGSGDMDDAELDFMDPASIDLLTETLKSTDKQQVIYSLRTLCGMESFDLMPSVAALLRHPAEEVVVETLIQMERRKFPRMEEELLAFLPATAGAIKAQALITLAATADERFLDFLSDNLEDDGREIKAGAIAGLIKYYGIEGMFRAVGTLKELLESRDEEDRMAMAALFGQIGIKLFYKPLIPLLKDGSPLVRKFALQSAARLQVPELASYAVALLRNSDTRPHALEALASYDEALIIPLLEPYFAEAAEAPLHLPKVYERIGTQGALDKLLAHYSASGFEMKGMLLEAMTRMKSGHAQADKAKVTELIVKEAELYERFSEKMARLGENAAYEQVLEAASQLRSTIVRRIFQLLELIYEAGTIQAVYSSWSEGDARQQANAMEVMDQLLQGQVRIELARIMTARGAEPGVHSKGSAQSSEINDSFSWLLEQGDEWLADVIRHTLGTGLPEERAELAERMERVRVLAKYPLFRELTGRGLSAVAASLRTVRVERGDVIFRVNDPGDSLYLLQSGTVGIYRNDEKIDERKQGDSFGQTAILVNRPRTATVIAEENGVLWRLDSADFYDTLFDKTDIAMAMMKMLSRRLRTVLAHHHDPAANEPEEAAEPPEGAELAAAAKENLSETTADAASEAQDAQGLLLRRVLVLQKIGLFAHLSQEDIVQLARIVEEVAYEAGETVVRMDEYGDALFGIIEGNVRVHRGGDTVAILGEGDCFGEMAVIDSGPRSASCTAVVPTVLLQLHREQVFSLCAQNMDVLKCLMRVLSDRLKGLL
ncbi:hypothetical protein D3H35_18690 [Cohnella faecalis]|uniref:Cyclic nucleotide-binding domain-containing protein n=3 Tax=Cohnella faecalis TaxID=2315694 RepID=A0A398CPN1_9BACL|nr:hypothetical protein D3H35_18690 [Cohnella faecalis]